MLKCHNLLVRLFQNGTGGHQVISKNQACQEICCHVLTCARSTTAACQSQNSLLGLSHRCQRATSLLCMRPSHARVKNLMFLPCFFLLPAALIVRNALLIRFLYHHCYFSTLVQSVLLFILLFIYNFKEHDTTYLTDPWWFAAVKQ